MFVCLSTKAVHLEMVSDYSSDAFLAALRRFTSRRGLCRSLYSDCGTNFVGAHAQLRAFFTASSSEQRSIVDQLAQDNIQWRFQPPAAPHFGGIWEAAVKSFKPHLRPVLGEATLTYEEMSTLLAQIEACLNSRPLQALTDDPDDLAALTPFLNRLGLKCHFGTEPIGGTHVSSIPMAASATNAGPFLGAMIPRVSIFAGETTEMAERRQATARGAPLSSAEREYAAYSLAAGSDYQSSSWRGW